METIENIIYEFSINKDMSRGECSGKIKEHIKQVLDKKFYGNITGITVFKDELLKTIDEC